MSGRTPGLRQLQTRLWPGFLLVALGAGALWWHRTSLEGGHTFATVVLFSVPVFLVAGVALLLRALKFKEQQLSQDQSRRAGKG